MTHLILPMKAPEKPLAPELFHEIQYPAYVSPKYDGIRATVQGGKLLTASMKRVPNQYVRSVLETLAFEGFDGELVVGKSYGEGVFQRTSSGIMSRAGEPDFTFIVFDVFAASVRYHQFETRLQWLRSIVEELFAGLPGTERLGIATYQRVWDADQLRDIVADYLEEGFEGAMVRPAPERGYYKAGRTTYADNLILKIKPEEDLDGVIVGFEEAMTNTNPAFTAENGRTKRSKDSAGLVPAGSLGALWLRTTEFGVVRCAPGALSHDERRRIWQNQADYMGKVVTGTFQRIGTKEAPRALRYKRLRHPLDVGTY